MAGFGRYGPYIEHDGKYIKIDADEVLTVGLNRAVTLIAEAKTGSKGGGARTSAPIKVLGEHPERGGKIEVLSGRYGPYIKFGAVNATLPKGTAPETITLDEAVKLIAARIENGGGAKKKAGSKAKAVKPKAPPGEGKSAKGSKKPKPAARKTPTKAASEAP
jgi:DNA topoisomerase-1